jgi:hypothetical protein
MIAIGGPPDLRKKSGDVRAVPIIAVRDSGVPGRFRFYDRSVTVENLDAAAGKWLHFFSKRIGKRQPAE